MAKSAAQKNLDTANAKIKALSGDFTFSDNAGFQKTFNSAYNDYNDWVNNPTAHGFNNYITDVNELYGQIMNYTYDPKNDALFQMFKNQYNAQGKRAMQNQMGVASAASGGYNSSAAQTSSQSKYQDYLNALNEKVVESYKYNRQNLLDNYNVARDMNNANNETYWKQADVLNNKVNNTYNMFNDERSFQYGKWNDNRSYWQNAAQNAQTNVNWEKDYALNKKKYTGK